MKDIRTTNASHVGVILMTYGSPTTLDDIPTYLKNVRAGRPADEALIAEFRRRYELIGGSPLLRITREQAAALQEELNRQHPGGPPFRVVAGMRFAPPFIADVVPEVAAGADQLIGVIMSPQYSPIIMGGYVRALEDAVAGLELKLKIAGDWHLQPLFLQALAQRVQQALGHFPSEVRNRVPVLLTAHSMPKLHAAGHTHVLIAPVQFLADHLEILYDIQIAARQQAEEHGIQFAHTESLNTSPLFIRALAAVVQETMGGPGT